MCSGSEAGSFKAHRLCVSLNSRLERNKEEDKVHEGREEKTRDVKMRGLQDAPRGISQLIMMSR